MFSAMIFVFLSYVDSFLEEVLAGIINVWQVIMSVIDSSQIVSSVLKLVCISQPN